ncbi:MAG: guanylate kinase [Candidatus Sericytochromatia bacterium]
MNLTSRFSMLRTQSARRGLLFVISGPSGVGKGTIVKQLLERQPALKLSVSVTTRAPRPGEVEGVNYYFRSPEEFQRMLEAGELLEYAQFVNGFYGTPRRFVEEQLDAGHDVVLEIDIKGAIQVKERLPNGVYVFVLPPTMEELEQRLVRRQTEAADAMRQRLQVALDELNYLPLYDYQIVNDELETAVSKVEAIIASEHCRVMRNLATL